MATKRAGFNEKIEQLRMETGVRRAALRDAFAISPAVIVTYDKPLPSGEPNQQLLLLSGEMQPTADGAYRITTMMKDGPWGHSTRATVDELIEENTPWGATVHPASEVEVIAWTSTPEYIEGSKWVAFQQADGTLRYILGKQGRYEEGGALARQARELAATSGVDAGVAFLEGEIKKLPTPNPTPRFIPNPAWLTRAMAVSYEDLERMAPPQWMPRLEAVRSKGKKLQASVKEYGCGAYGCVVPTLDDGVVLKATTDASEVEFATKMAASLVAPVCVHYFMAVATDARWRGDPVTLLWRESADQVGKLAEVDGEAAQAVRLQHLKAQDAYVAMLDHEEAPRELVIWADSVTAMATHHALRVVATGMLAIYRQQKIALLDVHEGNLGLCDRDGRPTWVITDPGNVVVIRPS